MAAEYPAFKPEAISTWRRVGASWFPVGPVPRPSPFAALPLRFKTAVDRHMTVNPMSPAIPMDMDILTALIYFVALRMVFPGDDIEQGIEDPTLKALDTKYPGLIDPPLESGTAIFKIPLIDLRKVEGNAVDITPGV